MNISNRESFSPTQRLVPIPKGIKFSFLWYCPCESKCLEIEMISDKSLWDYGIRHGVHLTHSDGYVRPTNSERVAIFSLLTFLV